MRKELTVIVLILSIHLFGQIPTVGLVAYYPFNGNANDESGNGNNAIVYGPSLTKDRFGVLSSAYNFDSNYIEATINNIPLNNSPRTITGWFKTEVPNFIDYESCIMNYGSLKTLERFSLCIYPKGYLEPINGPEFTNEYDFYINNYNYLDNNWYFFTLTYDGNEISLSTNAGQTYSKTLSLNTTNNIFRIGKRIAGDDKSDFFNGIIDDIRIYNRVLTQEEIISLYNENNTLGISSLNNSINIKTYPNPAKEYIVVDCCNMTNFNNYKLKITNVIGQIELEIPIEKQKTNVSLRNIKGNGVYFVNIINSKNNIEKTIKIFKN